MTDEGVVSHAHMSVVDGDMGEVDHGSCSWAAIRVEKRVCVGRADLLHHHHHAVFSIIQYITNIIINILSIPIQDELPACIIR